MSNRSSVGSTCRVLEACRQAHVVTRQGTVQTFPRPPGASPPQFWGSKTVLFCSVERISRPDGIHRVSTTQPRRVLHHLLEPDVWKPDHVRRRDNTNRDWLANMRVFRREDQFMLWEREPHQSHRLNLGGTLCVDRIKLKVEVKRHIKCTFYFLLTLPHLQLY